MAVQVQSSRSAHARRRRRLRQRRVRACCILFLLVVMLAGGGICLFRSQATKKNLLVHREAGIALMQEENWDGAIAEFDQAVKDSRHLSDTETDVLKYRAEAEYRQRDFEAALHTYEILYKEDAKNAELAKMNSLCLMELSRYEEALAIGGADAQVYARMSAEALDAGDVEAAVDEIQKGLQAAGEDRTLLQALKFNEAVSYEKKSDFTKALELFTAYRDLYGADEQVDREIAFLSTR